MKHFEIDLVEDQKLLPIYLRRQNDRCISHIKHVVNEVIIYICIYIIFLFWVGGKGRRLLTKRLVAAIFPYNTNAGLCHPSLLKQISLVARAGGLCLHKRLDCSNFSTYNLRLAAHFLAVLVRDMSWNYVCKLLKVFAVRSQNTKNKDHNLIFQLGMFIW